MVEIKADIRNMFHVARATEQEMFARNRFVKTLFDRLKECNRFMSDRADLLENEREGRPFTMRVPQRNLPLRVYSEAADPGQRMVVGCMEKMHLGLLPEDLEGMDSQEQKERADLLGKFRNTAVGFLFDRFVHAGQDSGVEAGKRLPERIEDLKDKIMAVMPYIRANYTGVSFGFVGGKWALLGLPSDREAKFDPLYHERAHHPFQRPLSSRPASSMENIPEPIGRRLRQVREDVLQADRDRGYLADSPSTWLTEEGAIGLLLQATVQTRDEERGKLFILDPIEAGVILNIPHLLALHNFRIGCFKAGEGSGISHWPVIKITTEGTLEVNWSEDRFNVGGLIDVAAFNPESNRKKGRRRFGWFGHSATSFPKRT